MTFAAAISNGKAQIHAIVQSPCVSGAIVGQHKNHKDQQRLVSQEIKPT
jgi:hydroxyethylthiazole kinase-like sugar kinase family protein